MRPPTHPGGRSLRGRGPGKRGNAGEMAAVADARDRGACPGLSLIEVLVMVVWPDALGEREVRRCPSTRTRGCYFWAWLGRVGAGDRACHPGRLGTSEPLSSESHGVTEHAFRRTQVYHCERRGPCRPGICRTNPCAAADCRDVSLLPGDPCLCQEGYPVPFWPPLTRQRAPRGPAWL